MLGYYGYSLVFSQSLLSLDLIESFLEHWDRHRESDDPELAAVSRAGSVARHMCRDT